MAPPWHLMPGLQPPRGLGRLPLPHLSLDRAGMAPTVAALLQVLRAQLAHLFQDNSRKPLSQSRVQLRKDLLEAL